MEDKIDLDIPVFTNEKKADTIDDKHVFDLFFCQHEVMVD